MNTKAEMILIAGNSHPELAEMIASRIKPLGDCKIYKRSEGKLIVRGQLRGFKSDCGHLLAETKVEISESIRGKDVFIIQTGSK